MSKLNYELVLSDFDGTLANSKNEVPAEVVEQINDYVKNGGVFAVCTGRILPCILPRVRQLGLHGLVVASQGCQIAEIESGKLIKNSVFTPKQASKVCACLEGLGVNIQLYSHQGFYSTLPENEPHLNLYEQIVGLKSSRVNMPLSTFAAEQAPIFCKAAVLVSKEQRQQLYTELLKRLGDEFDVTCSAKVLIEISPKGETKGKALKFLAQKYGIEIEKTIAIGDNLNDLSMVTLAGLGVAVGNGEQELKNAAKFIAPSCDEGAVAFVIKKFGYKND